MLPVVAICGRPNVGKSTLFNALSGQMISIVDPTSGVTRDRISNIMEIDDHYFELIDTGGIGIIDNQNLGEQIYQQVKMALDRAHLILFIVDIREGITPLDVEVSELLRKTKKNVVLIANKTDFPKWEMEAEIFRKLGFGRPICISAKEGLAIEEIQSLIGEHIAQVAPHNQMPTELKIAVVGKPNSGKSTLINALAEEERVIVSEIPGTTRDSIDVCFEKDGKKLIAIDTAGLKKSKNIHNSLEFYSQKRAERAIRRCDVALLLVDATERITRIDREIAEYIREQHKPVIIVLNKWDLVPDIPTSKYEDYISRTLKPLFYAPLSFITAKTGKNVPATIDLARNLFKQAGKRIGTGELNRVLQQLIARRSPPVVNGKQAKIYYGTQVGINPPTVVLFTNKANLISKRYYRYLFNAFQSHLNFPEVPVRIQFREKEPEMVKNETPH